MNFGSLSATDARKLVDAAMLPWMTQNRLFYQGDHLQNGAGWIGPGPQPGQTGYTELIKALEPVFISMNAIQRCVDNHVNAALGKEPVWGMVPAESAPEGDETALAAWQTKYQSLVSRADAALTAWWDAYNVHETLIDFATRYETEHRAVLRLFIPVSELVEGSAPKGTFEQCLMRLRVECPQNAQARVYRDSETLNDVGVYIYFEAENIRDASSGETERKLTTRAELTYLDDSKRTVLRTIGDEKQGDKIVPRELAAADAMDLGRNLWQFQIEGKGLVTPQVRSLQKLLNLVLTVTRRNLVENGWVEEFLINCQINGVFEKDEEGKPTGKFIPAPIQRGPGQSRVLKGATYTQSVDGDTGAEKNVMATPDVKWRNPVDLSGNLDTKEGVLRAIAEECNQEHLMHTAETSQNSGEYIKQRRHSFVMNLARSVAKYNTAGRWLLNTIVAVACVHAGEPNLFAELRPNFECRIDAGPLTAAEMQELQSMVDGGLLSRETAMNRANVADVDAERGRIEAERNVEKSEMNRAQLFTEFSQVFDVELAAQLAEFSPEKIQLIKEAVAKAVTTPAA